MRIAVLLPDLRSGGAERVGVNIAHAFASNGIQVQLVIMRNEGELLDALHPAIKILALNAQRPRYALFPLIRYLRANPVDALLANMWPLTVLLVLARMFAGVNC